MTRSPSLRRQAKRLAQKFGGKILTPEGWFTLGHARGFHIWDPPPAAAEVVVEQISKARMKRPEAMHLVFVPRLFTSRWRKHLTRFTDTYIRVVWDQVWDLESHFEPLLCFIAVPYRVEDPCLTERRDLVDRFHRSLRERGVSAISSRECWDLLRQLLTSARSLCALPKGVVSGVLRSGGK